MTKGELVDAIEALGLLVDIDNVRVPRRFLNPNIEAYSFSIDASDRQRAIEYVKWQMAVGVPGCKSILHDPPLPAAAVPPQ